MLKIELKIDDTNITQIIVDDNNKEKTYYILIITLKKLLKNCL